MEEIKPSERVNSTYKGGNNADAYIGHAIRTILEILDEQAAKSPEPSNCPCGEDNCNQPIEPSKCEHCKGTGITENSKDQEVECIHCDGKGKPSDSGSEKEASELKILSNRLQLLRAKGLFTDEDIATCLISEGYTKHPKSNELIEFNKKSVEELLEELHFDSPYLAKLICSKFGQPKAKVMSVEDIHNVIKGYMNDNNIHFKWGNLGTSGVGIMLAEEIHAAMKKEN